MRQQMFYQPGNNTTEQKEITLTEVQSGNDVFYKICHTDRMRPFFMTIVSDSDHWLFVSSNGGVSAGRKNPEYALFPYYTDDKITESAEGTGSKTLLRVQVSGALHIWEPFSARSEGLFDCQRNLYKSRYGNKVIFEEINHALRLTFRYEWNTSDRYGFVRKATLVNHGSEGVTVELLDGLQNILPYGVGSDLQSSTSNLADAYKRSELLPDAGLGIFALSAIIVDKAEPSEALKANVVWSAGIDSPVYLLSTAQLQHFRKGGTVTQETDVKGEKGAYFISGSLTLAPAAEKTWLMAANVNQSQAAVIQLADNIQYNKGLVNEVLADVEAGTEQLVALVAAADGLQYSADGLVNTRHYSNVLFNIMRGGIVDNNYQIGKTDFARYLQKANKAMFDKHEQAVAALPERFSVFALKAMAEQTGDADFIRLATEYLPLTFSRRHGDPSRPWNKFTINTRSEADGSKILDYEGNWRDIFQNWEALAHAYPAFIEGMIFKFLNASTFDGYNPYRVTKDGFDWETIEPDNPWSYIGYWGDHQVIYLLKFLEFAQNHYPQLLAKLPNNACFVYANVPYIIKPYTQILANPKDTIVYNHRADTAIRERVRQSGADGALLANGGGTIHYVTFAEKILAMLLAKLTNLVPDGGIWMNTQRPEWNDANNALVGNGLSMVTLYYLRRFLAFVKPLFGTAPGNGFSLSAELHGYFTEVAAIFESHSGALPHALPNAQKKQMLDALGEAASRYRTGIYENGFSGNRAELPTDGVARFIETALAFADQSILANKRADGLYHTYNLLGYGNGQLEIAHLSEMLEGQVAVLSSGCLSPTESLQLLDALRNSTLYRPDQDSYILYPNKDLPSFLQKNNVPGPAVESIPLLRQLLAGGGGGIIEKDIRGGFHFNGNLKNAQDLDAALLGLAKQYEPALSQDRQAVLALFEQVFNHKAFTGRSGTFFAYEGLGSIYWHMVSKLLLAVQETCLAATWQQADTAVLQRLYQHFDAIQQGIGVHKPPALYGAFPTDPYSHTPMGKGAQQPGMTGQVKEDILSRWGELGVFVHQGKLHFNPVLLKRNQFVATGGEVTYVNTKGERQQLSLEGNSLFFTYCQVPVVYVVRETAGIEITKSDGPIYSDATHLSESDSAAVFGRNGALRMIKVFLKASALRD
jgi:hypothetical protein